MLISRKDERERKNGYKELSDLTCYGILGDDGKNQACLMNEENFKNWKEQYQKDLLSMTYIEPGPLDIQRHYCDPDQTYQKKYYPRFFKDMESFLKKQEKNLKSALENEFEYKFVEGEGIEVCGQDKEGNRIRFYLRSDQLGFSAPSNEKSHPYDLYIMKSKDTKKAVENVAEWVAGTRTIGGSFLWPRPFYDEYNPARGGKFTSNRRYYIQDRVDLTLWEIQNWYRKKTESPDSILKRKEEGFKNKSDRESNLDKWLGHFSNFETYISFFCFDEFVNRNNDEIEIADIITGESLKVRRGLKGENPEPEITGDMELEKLENMLKRLCDKVGKRSISMQKII